MDVKDVAKVELFGIQNRTIEVTVNPSLLSQSGVMMADIASAFERQNKVVDAGAIETSTNRLRIEADGSFTSLEEIENLTVVSRKGEYFRLGEIAEIRESYSRPARNLMRIGNIPAVGIAISTVSDGNVVEMAELVSQQIDKLKADMPEGYKLDIIYDQGYESAVANDGFVMNLIVSVLTVVAVLLFFIGFKNGFLIGSGLIFSIFGTLIYMQATGIALQRMSLAAIIIAMGMLVDNAIVVYDAALVNMQHGMRKRNPISSHSLFQRYLSFYACLRILYPNFCLTFHIGAFIFLNFCINLAFFLTQFQPRSISFQLQVCRIYILTSSYKEFFIRIRRYNELTFLLIILLIPNNLLNTKLDYLYRLLRSYISSSSCKINQCFAIYIRCIFFDCQSQRFNFRTQN